MRFTVIAYLACALMASTVLARNCTKGLVYCGGTLLKIGDYHIQIVNALAEGGQATDESDVQSSLFRCDQNDNTNGDITYIGTCRHQCSDGGKGKSDHCTT